MRIMHIITLYSSICLFFVFLNNNPQPLIYLPLQSEVPVKEIYQLLVQPQKNAYLALKKIGSIHPLMGMLATYAGYLTTSNEFGEIIFLRHQEKTPLYIAITEEIVPVIRFLDTIDHWEFSHTKQTTFIEINLKRSQNKDILDEKFIIQTVPLPEDHIIPYSTITIFADPDDFEIPEGEFPHTHNKHWILPTLIVKKNATFSKNLINSLPFLQFFRPLKIMVQKPSTKEFMKMQK